MSFYIPWDSGIKVSESEIDKIIESGGGKIVKNYSENSYIVINENDENAYQQYVCNEENQEFTIYSQELILTGSLRQQDIDLDEYVVEEKDNNQK